MKIYLYILLLACTSCKTVSKIEVDNYPSNKHKVVVWYDKEQKDIWAISFPFVLTINNKSANQKEELTFHQYIYKKPSEGAFAFLYKENDNNDLIKLSSTLKKEIFPKQKKEYVVYSKHLINNLTDSNKILSTFKNKHLNTDSVHLSSFKNFKNKLPKLTQKLLSNDSIFLKFTNFDKKNSPPKRIKVPIKL
ncbi:hypothetical protein MHM83_15160 [Tenacibaculum sp. Mcav3-52]|uniref:hypothetical protein n=1 Tax=Tenacibaculum sp. Mcav3-52 TaxID=2917762 RepID=UPI001EF2FD1F|nr:hypothetical protein [Tenacibaculum sp. Mcav3-52]MCG7503206.1 hypothetical protein [Tenacibaculum sp. Mcav3-52]